MRARKIYNSHDDDELSMIRLIFNGLSGGNNFFEGKDRKFRKFSYF